MCDPISIGVGLALATSTVGVISQRKVAKAQEAAINEQNRIQAEEIADAAGQQLTERARAARRERGAMRAAASEAGINLGSGSFLAALQTSAINQYNDQGLIIHNERGQQRAREAQARSAMSSIEVPTFLGAALQIGAAGFGAYQRGKAAEKRGSDRATQKT